MNTSKQKGTIGELKVAQLLIENDYFSFTEYGDMSPIDIISYHKDNKNKLFRIQVKSTVSKKGKIVVYGDRHSSGYAGKYNEDDFDYFAVYVREKDIILFIPINDVITETGFRKEIRIEKPKNNQKVGINWFEDYLKLPH